MLKVRLHTKTIQGFTVVEVVLAMSIFSMLVLTLSQGLAYGIQATSLSGYRTKATFLAQEGLEAVRSIRDAAYANLTNGTFGLSSAGSAWTLTGANDVTEVFTRQVEITQLSTTTKQIQATVSWTQAPAGSVRFTEVLSDWRRLVPIGDWSAASQAYFLNLSGNSDGWKLAVQGNYAYILRNANSANLSIVDISNPTTPTLVSTFSLNDRPYDIVVSGNYAYIASASNNQELQIVNITNPASPSLAASYNATGNNDARAIDMSGSRVYLTRTSSSGTHDFFVFNVTNPLSPALNGSFTSLASGLNPASLKVVGNYAYVGTNSTSAEIQIVSITNPAAPANAGSLNLTGSQVVNTLEVYNSSLLVGTNGGTLFVINATNPTSLSVTGSLALGGIIADLEVSTSWSLAFVGTRLGTAEFQVVNLANLAAPVLKSSINTTASIFGVIYDASANVVYGVSDSNTEEFVKFTPN